MFDINFDISGIKDLSKELEDALKSATAEAAQELGATLHAKAVELANERLKTRRQMFIDALTVKEEDGCFILALDGKADWIDDGLPRHNMIENLLSSPKAKRAEDGSMYMVVPFDHSPGHGATNTTPQQLDLVNAVKSEMKRRKIPWNKVERDDQGRPKLGKLHGFNVDKGHPLKSHVGPGQGWGPVGDKRQGPNERQAVGGGPGGGGKPFLHGVAVYQHAMEGGGVRRSVMTFRIVSSKHDSPRWDHPGVEGAHIMDDVAKWAQEQVDNEIVPKIMESLDRKL